MKKIVLLQLLSLLSLITFGQKKNQKQPNILVIWGDDIGVHNISAYNHGMMGYQTPNIDRIAEGGALFTDYYAEQTCTAGRAAFITGQHPFRTGLLTIGMPGSEHGIPEWAPTIADVLKDKGYTSGQFGKNHLGDRDQHLPTNHGFDEFYGNLYHLNAEEEPEGYYYPKDPEFKKKYGPRGVIHSYADGRVSDTGPLTKKRMETIDDEVLDVSLQFMEKAHKSGKPFFIWHNATRMHVWTHLKEETEGRTGVGVYADGMVEHDDHVGKLLDKLEELGIEDNTIVMYSTDNGAETWTWPDGGCTPFHGAKGTNWEGGHRAPMLMKWPGTIQPGTVYNDIIAGNDLMPTLVAATGEDQLVEKMKVGYKANGKEWRVHLDGYNFLPYFKGEVEKGPRNEYLYFGMDGQLNAIRYGDFKAHFNIWNGESDIFDGPYTTKAQIPLIFNLRADPYERAMESGAYMKFAGEQMWLFVPLQNIIGEFLKTVPEYPFQTGSSLSASEIDYNLFRKQKANQQMNKLLEDIEKMK
ncbi:MULTISPECIES: arylsulfatase [Flammeovirga]|uniref:Arylsulfatase n=1 Tax=Flammeovirga agarivorans TaxID=2726742 RepID=A0A7X8SL36_9BACT|nr:MULTISPECIES: arylsulfatase [Flammeovirga]NLR92218.1 arylsulfatase [Flammeovirga agarivorans]